MRMRKPKNDHPIFFRLPSAVVERIDVAAYETGSSRTDFIRRAVFRALTEYWNAVAERRI
jgi:uncharacterized protein (DUF1778 family)